MWFEVLLAVLIILYIYNKGLKNISMKTFIKLLIIVIIAILVYKHL